MSRVQKDNERTQILEQPALRALLDRFETELYAGSHPRIEDFVGADTPNRLILLEELVHIEIEYQGKHGDTVSPQCYLSQFPELAENVECANRLRQTCERLTATEIPLQCPVAWRGFRSAKHKLVLKADAGQGLGPSPSMGSGQGLRPWLYFDLEKDPLELKNLAEDPARAGEIAELRKLM